MKHTDLPSRPVAKQSRERRLSAFYFTAPLASASPHEVAMEFDNSASIVEYVIATHDQDRAEPHVQGAFTCPSSRLTVHEVELRFAALKIPPGALRVKPLVRGRGLGRKPFIGYTHYLTHADPEQRARGKALYSRESLLTNAVDLWERVDAWLEVRSRTARSVDTYSAAETVAALLAHGLISMPAVRQFQPTLYRENRARFDREYRIVNGVPMPESDRIRLLQPLAQELLYDSQELDAHREAQKFARRTNAVEVADVPCGGRGRGNGVDDSIQEDVPADVGSLGTSMTSRAEPPLETQPAGGVEPASASATVTAPVLKPVAEPVRDDFAEYVLEVAHMLDLDSKGAGRESEVRRRVAQELKISPKNVGASAILAWYRERNDLEAESDEAIRADLKASLKDLYSLPRRIALLEFHALDGAPTMFEKAIEERRRAARFNDVLAVPSPRSEFSRLQRTKLLEASGAG